MVSGLEPVTPPGEFGKNISSFTLSSQIRNSGIEPVILTFAIPSCDAAVQNPTTAGLGCAFPNSQMGGWTTEGWGGNEKSEEGKKWSVLILDCCRLFEILVGDSTAKTMLFYGKMIGFMSDLSSYVK